MTATLVTPSELEASLKGLEGWKLSQGKLYSIWRFNNFVDAFAFITKVALLAEKMNHHPEWGNIYSTVTIELTTHDLGGVSNLDLQLAQSINSL